MCVSMIFKIKPCKCELLQPKIEESTTYGDFDPHPQLDIKF